MLLDPQRDWGSPVISFTLKNRVNVALCFGGWGKLVFAPYLMSTPSDFLGHFSHT